MDFLQVGRQFRKAQTDRRKLEPVSVHLTAPRAGFYAKHLAKSLQDWVLAQQELFLRKTGLCRGEQEVTHSSLPSPRLFQL